MILRLCSPDQNPSALEPILRLWLDCCPPDQHISQGNSQLQSWVLEGWQPCSRCTESIHWLPVNLFKRGSENGASRVCLCSFMKCHPENWSHAASTLLHFRITSGSLEWNSGLVIIASFCLFFSLQADILIKVIALGLTGWYHLCCNKLAILSF